jgi:hypothetical protein
VASCLHGPVLAALGFQYLEILSLFPVVFLHYNIKELVVINLEIILHYKPSMFLCLACLVAVEN